MPTKWYEGEIISIQTLTHNVKSFEIKIYEDENFMFIPGQFITLDLPLGEKRLQRWRSYSIANAPKDDNIIELCIVRLDNGLATNYLFDQINIGSIIKFKGPDGGFTLPNLAPKNLVMVCTGTGVAPFRSMISSLSASRFNTVQNIHLIYGARREEEILYREEFELLANTQEKFKYDIALSREETWQGYKGYVHQVYKHEYSNKTDDTHFYLCGWSKMIDEAIANLVIDLGYDKSQIHYELYG